MTLPPSGREEIVKPSENDTPSYRQEKAEPADAGREPVDEAPPLGSTIRGPIGKEGAGEQLQGGAEDDRRAAEERTADRSPYRDK